MNAPAKTKVSWFSYYASQLEFINSTLSRATTSARPTWFKSFNIATRLIRRLLAQGSVFVSFQSCNL